MLNVDFFETGVGPKVVLLHSSASSAGQWKSLMDCSSNKFNFIAINLIGYGKTRSWAGDKVQSLRDQVALIEKIPSLQNDNFSLVGHSFGGSVAMKAAVHFGERIDKLVLVEPNPFYLLDLEGRAEAFAEVLTLKNHIKSGLNNNWKKAVSFFADYWNGKGTWKSLTDVQKERFSIILKPNFYEWDAVFSENNTLDFWQENLPKNTTLISASKTVRTIAELTELFKIKCPNWNFDTYLGGHMAPITNPKAVNPLIIKSLI